MVEVGCEPRSVQLGIPCYFLTAIPLLPAFQKKGSAVRIISTAFECNKQYSGLLILVRCLKPLPQPPSESTKKHLYSTPLNVTLNS